MGSLQPSSPAASSPTGSGAYSPWCLSCGLRALQGVHPTQGFGVGSGFSKVHTLPGPSGVSVGPSAPLQERCVAGWGGGWSGCFWRIPQTAAECLFFSFSFWEIPPQSCQSIQGRICPLIQLTSPARPGTVWVRALHSPTLNSPQLIHTVSVGLPVCPYSPPCNFKQPGLSQCCSSPVR